MNSFDTVSIVDLLEFRKKTSKKHEFCHRNNDRLQEVASFLNLNVLEQGMTKGNQVKKLAINIFIKREEIENG
ncbi:hypothetical protein D9X91_05950 [Falsibacillus albus]|uniref:Uncharacterized protein n=1 Tax=Falsibacillus albus TaxID=2478915 RepID=A0A3L7K209_9BACI|nr:hypothetical protein D9X91_05950 [Falsibacillus albus]